MGTWSCYVTGAVLLGLLVHQSSSQVASARADQEAVNRDRFNFFDLELLKSLTSSEHGNLLFSPASVKAALAMILEGAGGISAKELKEALRLPDEEKALRAQFKTFLSSLQANNPSNTLESANKIFLSQTISPNPQYQSVLKKHYMAEIEKVNFASPVSAAQDINGWVNMLTRGLIPTLVEPGSLSRNTKLILANAMYFKGKWMNTFDFDKTSVQCFYVEVNQCLDTYLMESINVYNYNYVKNLHAHAVELPYEGNQFSLLLLLPTKRNDIQQMIRDLAHVSLHTIVSNLVPTDIQVNVPRFSIDYKTDLIHKLNELGIKEVFSSNANLTGMVQWGSLDLHISNIFHKAKMEVNEEGTVAAAATGSLVVPLMGTTLPKLVFDHPFLFFLRNTVTGDILFAGRLSEPEAAKQPALGTLNESELSELSAGIFTQRPVAGAGVPVSSTLKPSVPSNTYIPASSGTNAYNPASSSSNTYKPATNSSFPVPQTYSTSTNYYSSPKNLNVANNFPPPGLQLRSTGINPSHSNGNSGTYASNPDTIGAQYASASSQLLSRLGSSASAANSAQYPPAMNETPLGNGVRNTNQSNNDRIHFST